MSDCVFCKIINGQIPVKKIAETAKAIAIADRHPQAPTHALVMPKRHIASLNAMNSIDRHELLPELYELADRLMHEAGIRERGYRTVINNQAEGGQTVFHLHMHVLGGSPMREGFGA